MIAPARALIEVPVEVLVKTSIDAAIRAFARIAVVVTVAIPLHVQAVDTPTDTDADPAIHLQRLKTAVLDAAVEADRLASPSSDTRLYPQADPEPADSPAAPADAAADAISAARRWFSGVLDEALPSRIAGRLHDQPGAANDPRWQRAARLLEQAQPFSASRAVQQLGRDLDAAGLSRPSDWTALLARCLLAYGTPEPAKAMLDALPPADRSDEVRLRAQWALADYEFHHGQTEAALATIAALPAGPLRTRDDALEYETRMLQALALMSLGQDRQAAAVLAKIQPDPQRLLTASAEQQARALLPQVNLGIALLRAGQAEAGRAVLDRVGRVDARDPTLLALRDQANLVLGWHFLREANGATARPIFERIALEGPSSNRALLGLGWAALAPQGRGQNRDDIAVAPDTARDTPKFVLKALQHRRLINCEEFNRLSRAPQELCDTGPRFAQAAAPEDASRLAEKALAPWIELQTRDAADPAVREAWTALPHALAQLGAQREAQAAYETAIVKLEAIRTATTQTLEGLRTGPVRLPAAALENRQEPSAPMPTALLFATLRDNGLESLGDDAGLTAALSSLFDSRWLLDQAAGLDLPPDVIARARQLRLACERDVRRIATQALNERQQTLVRYLDAARSGLARLYDPSLVEPAETERESVPPAPRGDSP